MSARDFELQLRAEWAQKQEDLRDLVLFIATDALAGVVEKSPVDTGQFQNNWLVSIGGVDERMVELPGSFTADNAQELAAYAGLEGYPVIYLQNNLPYAARLEDGHSSQAPSGMVALTVAEIEAVYDGREV